MRRSLTDRHFDADYYATGCGRPYGRDAVWMSFFAGIANRIAADLRPGRTLDAECAWGLLVEALRARGIDAYGFDISSYAIPRSRGRSARIAGRRPRPRRSPGATT